MVTKQRLINRKLSSYSLRKCLENYDYFPLSLQNFFYVLVVNTVSMTECEFNVTIVTFSLHIPTLISNVRLILGRKLQP